MQSCTLYSCIEDQGATCHAVSFCRKRIHNPISARTLLKNAWHELLRALVQEWADMNCLITSANNFSGQSGIISQISLVQLAGSVRKSTTNRPFICPILRRKEYEFRFIVSYEAPSFSFLNSFCFSRLTLSFKLMI